MSAGEPRIPDLSNFGRRRAKVRKAVRTRWTGASRQLVYAASRAAEIVTGLGMMAGTVIALPLAFVSSGRGKTLTSDGIHVGRFGRRFHIYRLGVPQLPIIKGLSHLPIGLNLVRGDMSLVGPRPLALSEVKGIPPAAFRRFDVRPGIVSLFRLRRQANVAFEGEFAIDAEYVEDFGMKKDLGLLARYVTTSWLGDGEVVDAPATLQVLGIPIENLTMAEATDKIARACQGSAPLRVSFVNADCGNLTFRNHEYLATLRSADFVLADGIGMRLAGKILKKPIIENVNGTDMFPRLCERLTADSASIYLLGGRPGIAEGVASWVGQNYPDTKIAGFRDGYFPEADTEKVVQEIRESGARLLLVAFGAPRQDLWIKEHLAELGVGVAIGVGGLFDFYSQRIPRAPQWMRELGLEWLYRLLQEPGRLWKRYLVGNVSFLWRVLRYRDRHPSLS